MQGWKKCEQLKKIRKAIADANDIPYFIEECEHWMDCNGTCPKCDEEIEYINRALTYRAKTGENIIIDGLFADLFQGNEETEEEESGRNEEADNNCDDTDITEDIPDIYINEGGVDDEFDIVDHPQDTWRARRGKRWSVSLTDEELPFT